MEPPKPQPVEPIQQPSLPSRNEFIQNGFSDFSGSTGTTSQAASGASKQNVEIQQHQQHSSSSSFQQQQFESSSFQQQSVTSSTTQQVLNGSFEETGSVQGSSSSSSLLQKIMTPANNEYDSGSLKRRDPRKMFTDSSFYSAKHHPTVADQVEMAHKLSSAMFNEKNKSTKGQQMFLSRVQNAGEEEVGDPNKMPNLKHVMNPEGRMTEWEDVTKEDLPNAEMMAAHAAPIPNTPDPIAESLLAEAGKGGELFAKRRKRAENWVVDEASIGQAKPSAFADKFVHEQNERQSQFAQEQFVARQQKEAVASQQQMIQQTESQQNQSFAKQQFSEQQQQKQQQSEELRRQQAAAQMNMQNQIDFPDNFKHTSLKARSNTPSLDLSCHNVQGINVWANTAPRGWGGSTPTPKPQGLPKGPNKQQQGPPELSVCPATPSVDQEKLQRQQHEEMLRIQEEEMLRMQQQEEMLRQEVEMKQQQLEIQRQKEEQERVAAEYEQLQREKESERQQQEQQMALQRQQDVQRQQMELQRQQDVQRQQMQRQQEEMRRQEEQSQIELQRQQDVQRQQM